VNNKFKRVWKKEIVAYFEILSQNLPGGTDENDENISQGS
jgi:hypothetical protein